MNISFGAKLITSAESFIRKNDTEEDKKHIRKVFDKLDAFLSHEKVHAISEKDTVELVREKRKNKFWYTINYRSPKLPEMEPIRMHCGDAPKDFTFFANFHQLTHMIGFLNGINRKVGQPFWKFVQEVYAPAKTLFDK